MQAVFLGTGAAEGVPAAYCRCSDCQGVRKRAGREVKTRSSLRLEQFYQIDVSPDLYWQMLRLNMDMYDVEHVLITHTHQDHFALSQLTDKTMARETNGKPLRIYMSKPALKYVKVLLDSEEYPLMLRDKRTKLFDIIPLEYFGKYQVGELIVETIKGNHTTTVGGEYSINYLLTTPVGRKLLYALDTGYYKEETWEYLRGRHVDVLIMDCTFAGRTDRGEYADGHLALDSFLRMLERMEKIGFISSKTEMYATHFNPHQGLTHDGIREAFGKTAFRVVTAYDGLQVQV